MAGKYEPLFQSIKKLQADPGNTEAMAACHFLLKVYAMNRIKNKWADVFISIDTESHDIATDVLYKIIEKQLRFVDISALAAVTASIDGRAANEIEDKNRFKTPGLDKLWERDGGRSSGEVMDELDSDAYSSNSLIDGDKVLESKEAVNILITFLARYYPIGYIKSNLGSCLRIYRYKINLSEIPDARFTEFYLVFEMGIRRVREHYFGGMFIDTTKANSLLQSLFSSLAVKHLLSKIVEPELLNTLDYVSLIRLSQHCGGRKIQIPHFNSINEVLLRSNLASSFLFGQGVNYENIEDVKSKSFDLLGFPSGWRRRERRATTYEQMRELMNKVPVGEYLDYVLGALVVLLGNSIEQLRDGMKNGSVGVDDSIILLEELSSLVGGLMTSSNKIVKTSIEMLFGPNKDEILDDE